MTLGTAVRALAAQAARQFPNDMAAACKHLLAQCRSAKLQPPANPAEFIKYWQGRLTAKGDIRSNAHRSGRKQKLTDAKVQAAYKAMLAWEKAGRERPYESAQEAATECAFVKQLLAKTGAKFSTLLARIKQKHPRFGRHVLRAKWHMSAECQQSRLATAQDLIANYADKLDFVVHLDAKTVYLQETVIYGYVDLDVGYTVSRTASATKNSRVIKLRYYAAVNAKLGAFFIMYYTGTTDMPANRPGAHYKVGSGVYQHWLPPANHVHQCLLQLCSPPLGAASQARLVFLHPQPQHTQTPPNCCVGVSIVFALPRAHAIICAVGLCHQPAAVALSHNLNQQPVRGDHGKVPPLSARAHHNAPTHVHAPHAWQAACFYSIQLNQLLCICHIIQHPLRLAAPTAAYTARQCGGAGVGSTHGHVGTVLAGLLSS
jgi:hypothetical protein